MLKPCYCCIQADPCSQIRHSAKVIRRTHLCFYCHDVSESSDDVNTSAHDIAATIHTQLNRLAMLPSAIKTWEGPVSITLYLSDDEARRVLLQLSRGELPDKPNIKYHLVYKRGVPIFVFVSG